MSIESLSRLSCLFRTVIAMLAPVDISHGLVPLAYSFESSCFRIFSTADFSSVDLVGTVIVGVVLASLVFSLLQTHVKVAYFVLSSHFSLQPRVGLDFVHAVSRGRVGLKHAHYEVESIRIDLESSAFQSFLGIRLKAEIPLILGGGFVERLHGGQHHE